MNQRFFFRKEERLCSLKSIELLFREKKQTVFQHPVKLSWVYTEYSGNQPAQVLITVSRKRFRLATERNRIKRLMREVYRKNKHFVYDYLSSKQEKALLLLSFVGEKEISYEELERNFLKLCSKFMAQ